MHNADALPRGTPAPFRGNSVSLAARVGVFGVALFAVTIYALPQYIFPVLEPLRVGVLTAAMMSAGLVARWVLGGAAPTAGGLRVFGLVGFLAAAVASQLWSLDPAISRWAGNEALKMGLVYVAAASLLDKPERLRKVAWAVAIAGCVPAYYAVSNYLTGTNLLEGYRARWTGTFLDPNRLSMALVASSMILLAMRARLQNPVLRFLALAAVGLQIWGVVVTYSRGAALGLGVGLLVYLLTGAGGNRRIRSLAVVAGVVVSLLFLAPERFWNRTETIASYTEDASAMGRIYAWQTAANILERRPLTGVGASAFLAAWATYAPGEAGAHAYVAHNLILEVAAELGIPALLAFLVLLSACTWGAWRATRPPSPVPEEARGIVAALAGYLVCQMFAGFMLSFFLFLLLGLATAAERLARRERQLAAANRHGHGA
ncbi:O-antigen ligase family protein [Vulgatibacter sp.]|uniref:O-antigen ligase family protein n=1 Tax=Vulgatibacter sp. TaxID=1971226 RepID=UPI003564FFAF